MTAWYACTDPPIVWVDIQVIDPILLENDITNGAPIARHFDKKFASAGNPPRLAEISQLQISENDMLRRGFFTLALAIALCPVGVPAPAGPTEDAAILLNEVRAQNRRKPLILSQKLSRAAQAHADDMAAKGYFSHKGQDGSKISTRVKRQGFKACYYAENIAQGQRSAAEVMNSWQNSSGHRKNNLAKQPTHFGIGLGGVNTWVLVFAKAC